MEEKEPLLKLLALLALLPAGLALAAWLPDPDMPALAVDSILVLVLSTMLSRVVRDEGKRKEPALWRGWGGPPVVALLRRRDGRLDDTTLARYHACLASMGLPVPTAEEEAADPNQADQQYNSCARALIEKTRDKTKYPLVFAEVVNYGFRRNLWGIHSSGLVLALAGTGASAVAIARACVANTSVSMVSVLAVAIGALAASWWIWRIRPAWVKLAADAYALRLLGTLDSTVMGSGD